MLTAVSPIDGRYADKTKELGEYFSELALIKYRLLVEVEYFIFLTDNELPPLKALDSSQKEALRKVYTEFSLEDGEKIKATEKITNHDVKAVEYFLKEKLEKLGMGTYLEFVHFGLTSQDINNTAIPISIKEAILNVYLPQVEAVTNQLEALTQEWQHIPMLARTHGQSASPTGLGKELYVFVYRLQRQINKLKLLRHAGKFGGATGNFNAHYAAYPEIDWTEWGDRFLQERLGIDRYAFTTQIEHYDGIAELMQLMNRISNILTDFCRDIWTYISMDYFKQKTKEGEIGSSAMPHKVNPIDFENAEGNLGIANAICDHLANKLPISRLQRDLTDSTVLRNIGVPFAHHLIAFNSIQKGMSKLVVNEPKIEAELDLNWAVVAEAIQNILRRESYPQPYEALKELTRGKIINQNSIHEFIDQLEVPETIKTELKKWNPSNYTGNALFFNKLINHSK